MWGKHRHGSSSRCCLKQPPHPPRNAASRDRNVRLEWQSIQQMLVLIVRVNGSTDGYLQLAATGRVEAVVPPSSLIARLSGWWERLNWLWLYS